MNYNSYLNNKYIARSEDSNREKFGENLQLLILAMVRYKIKKDT